MKTVITSRFARICPYPVIALVLVFITSSESNAHSDPWGDIHPQVTVEDGKFAVIFNTSLPEKESDYTNAKPVSQSIYTPEGKLFAPRHPLDRKRSYQELGPVGLYGRELKLGETSFYFSGDRSGKPSYVMKSPEGKLAQVRLPWPESVSLGLFEDAIVAPGGIAITGKEGERRPDGGFLRFYWFPHDSTGTPEIQTIGTTACIYDFPVASNIAFAGGKFWLAYMRPVKGEGCELILWSWKPGAKKGHTETLDSPGDWNSHLSMAAIGDRLCLAYHCVDYEHSRDGMARIVTVFRKAE